MTRPTTTPRRCPAANLDLVPVTVTGHAAASIAELLELCDEFLRTASPAVRAELRSYLDQQPARLDTGWMIDMLGFNALYLHNKLALASTAASTDRQAGGQP